MDGGLKLVGWIPLVPPFPGEVRPHPHLAAEPKNCPVASSRLLLAVEPLLPRQQALRAIAQEVGSEVFFVDTHEQLLEWALALPAAAILAHAGLKCGTPIWATRLKRMGEEKLLDVIPLWVMAPHMPPQVRRNWEEAGAQVLLDMPVQPPLLQRLLYSVCGAGPEFYLTQQMAMEEMVPESLLPRLSELTEQLIKQVELLLEALEKDKALDVILHQSHAVRSAALTLGYFRLAALMAQVEYIARQAQPSYAWPGNRAVIVHCLRLAFPHL